MLLPSFAKVFDQLSKDKRLEHIFSEDTLFSYPVLVRREGEFYDGVFMADSSQIQGDTGTRPNGWMLLSTATGKVALVSDCKAADFIATSEYPFDAPVSLRLPEPTDPSRIKSMENDLLGAYDELREFAFEESLSREQVAVIVRYKDLFTKLCPRGMYPFYHALSPAFFHWLRLPLPDSPEIILPTDKEDIKQYQYQLLILENLQMLVKQFQDKIATDRHKEKLFDNLHKEVQEYKNGFTENLTRHMELDVINLIDSLERTIEALPKAQGDQEKKLFNLLEGVMTDLTDILYRQGVDPYTCPGDTVDITRQTTISTVKTREPVLDRRICSRTAKGWSKEGKVIRPERVTVYIYDESANENTDTNIPKG